MKVIDNPVVKPKIAQIIFHVLFYKLNKYLEHMLQPSFTVL